MVLVTRLSGPPSIIPTMGFGDIIMIKSFDIAQRAFDGKFVTWAEIDSPDADRDWHVKNGLPVPTIWVPVAVTFTRDAAVRATKSVRL